jgi:hypothetical protein
MGRRREPDDSTPDGRFAASSCLPGVDDAFPTRPVGAGVTDEDLTALVDHLQATEERPCTARANQWLGEAQAVAEDAAAGDLDAETLEQRLEHVRELLAQVDGTGDDAADEHVAAARRLVADLLD